MADDDDCCCDDDELSPRGRGSDEVKRKTDGLTISANTFASAMTRAFTQATAGGLAFEEVLKRLALQISSMAVAQAFRPVATQISQGIGDFLPGILGGAQTVPLFGGRDSAAQRNVTVQVQTPDLGSFRRSEAYLSGQIARAVARGQRSL